MSLDTAEKTKTNSIASSSSYDTGSVEIQVALLSERLQN